MQRLLSRVPALPLLVAGALCAAPAFAQEDPPAQDPGPGAPPAPGDAEKDGADGVQQPAAERDAEAPPADAKPKGSDATPTSSVLMTYQGEVPAIDETVTTQEDVVTKDYVTFSGTATCTGCEGSLLLMVEYKAEDPGEKRSRIVTVKPLAETGPFEMVVPQMEDAVILHLLVDANNSGGPDRGERTAMLELGGKLVPAADRSKLDLDGSAQD